MAWKNDKKTNEESCKILVMRELLHSLTCHARNGTNRIFWYEWERDEVYRETVITFRVHKSNPPKMLEENWFEMTLERCADGFWKITYIGDVERRAHYTAVGIPDALIPEASRVLGAAIRSSSNVGTKGTNEFRTQDADKMWTRLQTKGLARYLRTEDYYICDAAVAGQHPPR